MTFSGQATWTVEPSNGRRKGHRLSLLKVALAGLGWLCGNQLAFTARCSASEAAVHAIDAALSFQHLKRAAACLQRNARRTSMYANEGHQQERGLSVVYNSVTSVTTPQVRTYVAELSPYLSPHISPLCSLQRDVMGRITFYLPSILAALPARRRRGR